MTKDEYFELVPPLEKTDYARIIERVHLNPNLARDARRDGWTLLHLAANDEQPVLAELLLSYGADVNAYEPCDGTPLHGAAASGNVDIVRALLERGAVTNMRDGRGMTPLDWACLKRNVEVVRMLLDSGAVTADQWSNRYIDSLRTHGVL